MPSLRQIRRRIRSVRNTAKVTKAMEMVAASKMRRAQQRVLQGRPYAQKLMEVMAHLAAQPHREEEAVHPLMQVRPVRRSLVVHITPDRGLCGGLNAAVNRRLGQFIMERRQQSVDTSVVAVGRKGRDFAVRTRQDVKAVFIDLGDRPSLLDTLPISRLAMDEYASGNVDEVYLSYTEFVNTAVQRPVVERLLPLAPADDLSTQERVGYIYEPDPHTVYNHLLPRFVEMEVYHAILEAAASEQAARMVAMRNATDNAMDVVQELTLEMNKVRQDTITRELLDIVGAVAGVGG